MGSWLNLCRWPNLLMVGVAQFLFKYAFLPSFEVNSSLSDLDFFWLCLAVILVTASGNIINDIHDLKTDFVNQRARPLAKGKISISHAYIAYFIFNLVAICSVLYLSVKQMDYSLVFVVLSVVGLLFLYAKFFKSIPLIGNMLVSTLVSLSFLLVLYVELFSFEPKSKSLEMIYWIIGYGGFAFWANLNREWIKDIIDIKGDYAQNMSTLPILLGKSRMNVLIFASSLLLILALLSGVKIYFQLDLVFILYLTFGICLPLCFVLYHIYQEELKANYKLLSHIYKFVMLMGVFSLILFRL